MQLKEYFIPITTWPDNKALLESIARSFGYHYGLRKNVRINTVSQSPTITTGSGVDGFDGFYSLLDDLSPLGNAPQKIVLIIVFHYFQTIQKK